MHSLSHASVEISFVGNYGCIEYCLLYNLQVHMIAFI